MAHTVIKRLRLLPALLILALLAGTAVLAVLHPFDDDEFQHAHYAWLLHHGQRPFVDFFEHHLPTYHLLVAPVYAFGESPETLFALRFVSWICLMGTLFCIHGTGRTFCSGPAGPSAAVLLTAAAPIFLVKMLEARPEAPAIFCFAASLRLLFARPCHDHRRTMLRLALAGFLAGAVPALSHKYALPAAALLAGAFLLHGVRLGTLFTGMSGLPLLSVLAWAAWRGILGDLYQSVFVLGVEWQHRFSPSGYLVSLWSESALLVTTGLAGLVLMAGQAASTRRHAIVLSTTLAAAFVTLFLVPEPYRQSFLPLFPLLAIGAAMTTAAAWQSMRGAITHPAAAAAAWVVLAAAVFYPTAVSLAADLSSNPFPDLRRMRSADATGSPCYFDGRGLVFYRAHTGRHACMHQGILSMLEPGRFAAETVAALRAADFPTVLLDYRVLQMPPEVVSFIRDHYLPLDDDIFVPGIRVDRSRLAGRQCPIRIPVSGLYRMSWRGGKVQCDGRDVAPDVPVLLAAGTHTLKGVGFVDGFAAVLTQRTPPAEGAVP